jgi:hypothetical protein
MCSPFSQLFGSLPGGNLNLNATTEMYKIFCLLKDRGGPFSVKIDETETVDDLKCAIKDKNQMDLAGVDSKYLNLYLEDIKTDNSNYMAQANDKFKKLSELDPLSPLAELRSVFGGSPARLTIHILVTFPPGESIDSRACDVCR